MAIKYTKREEQWNAWSHAAGIALGVVVGILFLMLVAGRNIATDAPSRSLSTMAAIGVALYLFGMLASYIASTAYHSLPRSNKWKERLRQWDHAAIYWHIAGSYSPITLVALRSENIDISLFSVHVFFSWGWTLFCFVWLCAIAGTIVSFRKLKEHSLSETFCFIAMGLSVLVAFGPLLRTVSTAAVVWIIAEGVCYITGAVFYMFNKRRFMHSVFHFFVLAGSVCHIIAVWDVLVSYLQQ